MLKRMLLIFALMVVGILSVGQTAQAQTKPPADIVFIIDQSFSTELLHAGIVNNVDSIATQLEATLDPRYGLVGFGQSENSGQPETLTDLTTQANFSTALNDLTVRGSAEPGVTATGYSMTDINGFRADAGVCVVLVTDEDSNGDGDLPAALAAAKAALDARDATFFGIVFPNAGNTEDTYGPNPGSLSAHTGGDIFDVNDFVVDETPILNALLNKCIESIEDIMLAPETATTDVADSHSVTASLTDGLLNPLVGVEVRFEVTAGPNAGTTGAVNSDANGEATFSYSSNGTVGTDEIVACFTNSRGGEECSNTVTNVWSQEMAVRTRMSEALGSFSYDPTATTYGSLGELTINFKFTYNTGLPLYDVNVVFNTANSATIVNADGGNAGVGSKLSVANTSLPGNNERFDETEELIVTFVVAIDGTPWGVNFDMFAKEDGVTAATASGAVGSFTINSSMFDLENVPQMESAIFLPFVQ